MFRVNLLPLKAIFKKIILSTALECVEIIGLIGAEYNSVGQLIKLVYPDNTTVNYYYDYNGNLVRVKGWANRITSYTYDENNNITAVTKPDGSITETR